MQSARPATLPRDIVVWLIAVCALCAFIALAVAEEGVDATRLTAAPDAPLPFARDRVFGLDLSPYRSVEALTWLQESGSTQPWSLVVLPADEDVVAALAAEVSEAAALLALDSLVNATNGAPVAMCLRRPVTADAKPLAEAVVDALATRYAGQVVYAFACDGEDRDWQRLLNEESSGTTTTTGTSRLLPVAGAAVIALDRVDPISPGDLVVPKDLHHISVGYVAYQVPFETIPDATTITSMVSAVRETAHASLLLAQPNPEVSPAEFTAALIGTQLPGDIIPQGYSRVSAPGFAAAGAWRLESVATTPYAVAAGSLAELSATVLGTDISLITVFGPNTGEINVWIDPEEGQPLPAPDETFDLTADQAQPIALLLADGLAAREHRVIIQAVPVAGGEIRIAGLFVTGGSALPWTGFLASLALLIVGVAALTERAWSAVRQIRASRPGGRRAVGLMRARYRRD